MILGHFTVTYAIREPLRKKFPLFKPVVPLIIGVLLPDIIDKPAARIFGLYSRGIAHSVIILSLAFFISYRLFAKHKAIVATLFIGAYLHLLEDLPEMGVIFWPIISSWHFQEPISLLGTFHRYYCEFYNPLLLTEELISYPFCLYFFWKNNFSNIKAKA